MTSASSYAPEKGSKLVQTLSKLATADIDVSHKHFAERLGQLIDLSDSFSLSETLRGLKKLPFIPNTDASVTLMDKFLQSRSAMVQSIIKSFAPDTVTIQLKLYGDKKNESVDDTVSFEPYLRLYTTQQSEMDFQILKLRAQVRQAVTGYSAELAQLAALDAALGDMLLVHTRKLFTVIPKLLKKRFEHLHNEHQKMLINKNDMEKQSSPAQSEEWLKIFYQEMQGLLLAELEVRLQPIAGLIEAFNEEVEHNT